MAFAVLDGVTLSQAPPSAILYNVTLSEVPQTKVAVLDGVTLSRAILSATLEGVTLSEAPIISPVTGYISFDYILTGSLADNLMEIYYEVVDGHSYGVISDPEMLRVNRLVGRGLFEVEFDDGYRISTSTYYEFLYEFVTNVAAGRRLPGENDIERSMHLSKSLPSTFNPNWLLAAELQD